MKRTLMVAMALSLLTSAVALADPPGDRGHGDRDHREWRHDDHGDRDHHDWRRGDHGDGDHREWRHDDHGDGDHREWRRDDHDRDWRDRHEERHYDRFEAGEYRHPHGYYVHEWRRGDRLPIGFRAPVYVVPNVVVYHLRPPPPGYYWVRVDNNAVLAAVATGVVVDVAYNLFH